MAKDLDSGVCIFCGADIVYLSQFGGWNSVMPTPLELDNCWCPEADPLLILGRSTKTGYMKHMPKETK